MKRILSLLPACIILFLLVSCGDKDKELTPEQTEKDKILINYPWKMTRVTDLNGQDIAKEKLDLQTRFITEMDIEFVSGNKVYAKDAQGQVINGGTWYLIDDMKVLDVDISGFKGKFGVQELTNSTLKLKSTMPVSGVDQEAIMVFAPVIK